MHRTESAERVVEARLAVVPPHGGPYSQGMSLPSSGAESTPEKGPLGLALAGGGFRASLFHVGVLRRLAELDLLRKVEYLSTVSGGSITGALYVLLLKSRMERPEGARLSREEYVELTKDLERILVRGIHMNLRTLLFANPFGLLRVLLTGHSMAGRMARLYERYLFEPVVRELAGREDRPLLERLFRPGKVRLGELPIRPGGCPLEESLSEYNRKESERGGSVITTLIVNATTLNSGARFWFSAEEVGDWYLGAFRRADIPAVLHRKELLEELSAEELAARAGIARTEIEGEEESRAQGSGLRFAERDARTLSLAHWWRCQRDLPEAMPLGWEPLFSVDGFPGDLATADLGHLRSAKEAAAGLRGEGESSGDSIDLKDRGGPPLRDRLFQALVEMDRDVTLQLRQRIASTPEVEPLLLDFLVELYLLKTGERASPDLKEDWEAITLGDAVGASACFPPVFPPFLLDGIYDDAFVSRLALTDGGAYDNRGLTTLMEEGCDRIIASDTGGIFHQQVQGPSDHAGLVLRASDVLMNALGGVQTLIVRERRRLSRALARDRRASEGSAESGPAPPGPGPALTEFHKARRLEALAYFHIDSPAIDVSEGPAPVELPTRSRDVALLRTDLDTFGEVEVRTLVNHGYATADRYVREYMGESFGMFAGDGGPSPPSTPLGGPRVDRILRAGRSRSFRSLKLREPVSLALAAAAVLLIPFAILRLHLTPARLADGAGSLGARWLELLTAPFPEGMVGAAQRVAGEGHSILLTSPTALAALVLLALAGVFRAMSRIAEPELDRDPRPRKGLRGRRGLKARLVAFKWNVLWLVAALPLVLAAAATAVFGTTWLASRWLFLRAASARPGDERGSASPDP